MFKKKMALEFFRAYQLEDQDFLDKRKMNDILHSLEALMNSRHESTTLSVVFHNRFVGKQIAEPFYMAKRQEEDLNSLNEEYNRFLDKKFEEVKMIKDKYLIVSADVNGLHDVKGNHERCDALRFLEPASNAPYERLRTNVLLKNGPKYSKTFYVSDLDDYVNCYTGEQWSRPFMEYITNIPGEAVTSMHITPSGKPGQFHVSLYITVFGENQDEIEQYSNHVKALLNACGIMKIDTSKRKQEEYLLNNLLMFKPPLKKEYTTEQALQMAWPFYTKQVLVPGGYYQGIHPATKMPLIYDNKSNGLILGVPGSGTGFVKHMHLAFRRMNENARILSLDPEGDTVAITKALHGKVLDLKARNQDFFLNPCDLAVIYEDPASPLPEKCDFMVALVETVLSNEYSLNAEEIGAVNRATNKMYQEYIDTMVKRQQEGSKEIIDRSICPTLVDFYNELLADGTETGKKIALAMEIYCVGDYDIFAHRTTLTDIDSFTVYNLLHSAEKMKAMAMLVCLNDMQIRIQQDPGIQTYVYLDELHVLFKRVSYANQLLMALKRARMLNASYIGICMDICDIVSPDSSTNRSGIAAMSLLKYIVCLNQSPQGRKIISDLYQLSDEQVERIRDHEPGCGMLITDTFVAPFEIKYDTTTNLYKILTCKPNYVWNSEKQEEEA